MKLGNITSVFALVLMGCSHGPGISHSPVPMPAYTTSVRIENLKEERPLGIVSLTNALPMPVYPPDFARAGMGGTVDLRLTVRHDGSVGGIQVVRSSNSHFEAAAVRAVSQWKFVLRKVSGPIPEEVPTTVTIVFSAVSQAPNQIITAQRASRVAD